MDMVQKNFPFNHFNMMKLGNWTSCYENVHGLVLWWSVLMPYPFFLCVTHCGNVYVKVCAYVLFRSFIFCRHYGQASFSYCQGIINWMMGHICNTSKLNNFGIRFSVRSDRSEMCPSLFSCSVQNYLCALTYLLIFLHKKPLGTKQIDTEIPSALLWLSSACDVFPKLGSKPVSMY